MFACACCICARLCASCCVGWGRSSSHGGRPVSSEWQCLQPQLLITSPMCHLVCCCCCCCCCCMLLGMGYQAYLNTGGIPRGNPGFSPEAIYDPIMSRIVPYLLLTAVLGVFLLTQMRKLMIIDWRLPFPSGTASGLMLASFHTKASATSAPQPVSWSVNSPTTHDC